MGSVVLMENSPPFMRTATGRSVPGTPGARTLFWRRFWELFRAYQGDGAGSVSRSLCCFLAEVTCDVFLELHRMAGDGLALVDEPAVGRAFDLAPQVVENVGAVPRVIEGRDEALVLAYNPRNHPRCSCYDVDSRRLMHYPSAEARRGVVDFLVEAQKGLEARAVPPPVNAEANLLLWAAEEVDARIVAGGCGPGAVPASLSAVRAALPALEREFLSATGLLNGEGGAGPG